MRWTEIAEGVNDHYLYHGTGLDAAVSILLSDQIDASSQYEHNPTGVSLTREYHVAHEFGTIWERRYPVVFVLDAKLMRRHQIKPVPRRDSTEPGQYRERAEAEEMVVGDMAGLSRYCVSINVKPADIAAALKDREWLDEQVAGLDQEVFASRRTLTAAIRKFAKSPLINRVRPRMADYLDRDPKPIELPPGFTSAEYSSWRSRNGIDVAVAYAPKQNRITVYQLSQTGRSGEAALRELGQTCPVYMWWNDGCANQQYWTEAEIAGLHAKGLIAGTTDKYFT